MRAPMVIVVLVSGAVALLAPIGRGGSPFGATAVVPPDSLSRSLVGSKWSPLQGQEERSVHAGLAKGYPGESLVAALPGDEYWSSDYGRGGVWGRTYSIGGYQSDLVIGGRFSFAGSTPALNIARWNGSGWQAIGGGVGTYDELSIVSSVVEFEGKLVVGGSRLGRAGEDTLLGMQAAYWDGSGWHGMSTGDLSGSVHDLAILNGQLYAGGTFSGQQGVARWDGSGWRSVGAPFLDGWDLLVKDGRLLVAAVNIYAWDGSTWTQPFGEVTGGAFVCLADWDGDLLGGGSVNGIRYEGQWVGVRNVAHWTGSGWEAMSGGLYGWYDGYGEDWSVVWSVAVYDGAPCAGGRFTLTSVGGVETPAYSGAIWKGDHWEGIGGGVGGYVHALQQYGGDLIVGGDMVYVGDAAPENEGFTGDVEVRGIARWDGTTWHGMSPIGHSPNGAVHCLGRYGDRLVAAGEFTRAGDTPVTNIAAFDGSSWEPLGEGLQYSVAFMRTCYAMVEYDGSLIVGGKISSAGGQPVQNVARWDGQAWSAMGGGIPTGVQGLGVSNGQLYADRFRWTGTDWEEYFAVDGKINAYCEWNGLLVLGGEFHNAGGQPADHIVGWDGVQYVPIGGGLPGEVRALCAYNGVLVAAGNIGSPFWNIAQWDGEGWSSVGGGLGAYVQCLTVLDGNLFMGGDFGGTMTAAANANRVVRWDGSTWQGMGSGCGDPTIYGLDVFGMTLFRGSLFVGGEFTIAGNKPSWYLGRWRDPMVPVSMQHLVAQRSGRFAIVRGEVADSEVLSALEVWRSVEDGAKTLVGVVAVPASGRFEFRDTSAPREAAEYWLKEAGESAYWYGPVQLAAEAIPERLLLAPATPNPFNPRTMIRYSLPRTGRVALVIYDLQGRRVRSLVDKVEAAGEQSVVWDGQDDEGQAVASGGYVARLVTDQGTRASKLMLIR